MHIDHEIHRVLTVANGRILLSHISTNHIFLVSDRQQILRVPTLTDWSDLVGKGRAGTARASPHIDMPLYRGMPVYREAEKIAFECDLLDRYGVSNGLKAMSIFLHAHWTDDLVERFGPHTPVNTLKRWRTQRSQHRQNGQG